MCAAKRAGIVADEMDEAFARVSKAGRVVCGKLRADGSFSCDVPLADIVKVHEPPHYPERMLLALPGWRQDRKGIWRRTTSATDRRAHGRPPAAEGGAISELPALICCPKCATVQWLEAERLRVQGSAVERQAAVSRWVSRRE